jgi:hypothetical protein
MTRRPVRFLIALAALVLPLALGTPAHALNFADDNCAENPLIVDDAVKMARVVNGYNCSATDLTIRTSLTPIVDPVLPITAKSITILGPDILDPAKRVEIISDIAGSDVLLTAQSGNIDVKEGSIKAHHLLKLECKGLVPLCKILGDLSDFVAAANFVTPTSGGDLKLVARGDIDIRRSTVHGGDRLEVNSANGSLTLICVPGEGGCKDPLGPPFVVNTLCPGGFPCTPTFLTPADLKAVCIQAPGVHCNGGAVEKRFEAKFDIDITGSKIDSIEHMTFETDEGNIKASGAELTSTIDNIRMTTKKGTIDLSKATVLTPNGTTIILAEPNCPAPPAVCINLREADLDGKDIIVRAKSGVLKGVIDLCGATVNDNGADFPTFNADSTPPYSDPSVLDEAGECPAPPGPATIS